MNINQRLFDSAEKEVNIERSGHFFLSMFSSSKITSFDRMFSVNARHGDDNVENVQNAMKTHRGTVSSHSILITDLSRFLETDFS